MNDQLAPSCVAGQRDDLEQCPIRRRAEVKPEVAVEILDRHRVAHCVLDVLNADIVIERSRVKVHTVKS